MLASGKRLGQGGSSTSNLDFSSSNEQLKLENESNPLMNSVVLATIFEFCDLSDLLEHRLVCKEWYSVSVTRIRNEAMVKVSKPKSQDVVVIWSNFHKEFDIVGPPFRCFRIQQEQMYFVRTPSPLVEENNTVLVEFYKNVDLFWEQYGQFMRKLELIGVTICSEKTFKKALFEQTPQLEELKLKGLLNLDDKQTADNSTNELGRIQSNLKSLSVELGNSKGPFPIQWKHLFLQFPNVQKLEVVDMRYDVITALHEVCESLDEIPLKELVLKRFFSKHGHAHKLKQLLQLRKLQLSKLEIGILTFALEEDRSILEVALRSHRNTLKELVVGGSLLEKLTPSQRSDLITNLLQYTLEQLTLLDLMGSVFQTFRFLERTPNLKILRLRTCGTDTIDFETGKGDLEIVKNNNIILPLLKKFEIIGNYFSGKEMEAVVRLMPNVEEFKGKMDGSALRVICENWRKLRVLNITIWDMDDEALTGIQNGRIEDTRLPNITDLKDLQELNIQNLGNTGDSCIRNAILKMPHLRTVRVMWSKEMSEEALDALRKQFPDGVFHSVPEFLRKLQSPDWRNIISLFVSL